VLVDWLWIFGLSDNLKQIFVRKEKESWEHASLSLQELLELLLNRLKASIQFNQGLYEVFDVNDECTIAVLLFVDS